MKLYATIENEKGKLKSLGGNEFLDFDIMVGNDKLVSLTLRYSDNELDIEEKGSFWVLYDEDDNPLYWIPAETKKAKSKGEKCSDCGQTPCKYLQE